MDSKLPTVGTTIFTVMTELAARHGALNLSQGFPSFEPDPRLVERVTHHLRYSANQYAPLPGVLALRAAIAGKVADLYGRSLD
ncbi:MAG TPA: methionine aminotransferase, partial [Woeseiaceae bacterium]|nr:methionine aminotransferase [Woeseiaceae bacterium]